MYGCESWTVKKAEHQRIDAFELWCWRRLLRVPWTARRSNQSILKEISPGCSLEGLMLKLKLQNLATSCEELTHWGRPWFWERLRAGGDEDDRGWVCWMASPTQWTGVWVDSGSLWWTGRPGVLWFMGSQRVGHDWVTELNWTELKVAQLYLTLCDPMDYTVLGTLQARILEWVAFPFSRVSSQPKDRTQVSHIAGGFSTSWVTREAQEYWNG